MRITNNCSLSNPAAFQGKINPELVKKLQNPDRDFNLQILKDSFTKRKTELLKEDRELLKEVTKKDIMEDYMQYIKSYADRLAAEYLSKNKK